MMPLFCANCPQQGFADLMGKVPLHMLFYK
jgi:hypothetical protein